jgi:hypothetical protein
LLALVITGLLGASLGGAQVPLPECYDTGGAEFVVAARAAPALELVAVDDDSDGPPELVSGNLRLVRPRAALVGTIGDVACFLSRKRGTGFIPTDKSPRPPRLFLTFTVGSCRG